MFVDTSVIGGCLDDEFALPSRLLFAEFRSGRAVVVVSLLTLAELELAPSDVRMVLTDLPVAAVEYVEMDEEAARLADAYIADGVVGLGSLADAQQVAIATVNKVDVIVSWNFRHIVNLNRIRLFTATNLRHGLPTPEIRSPLEVLTQNEEEV
jgi:hypothetical protein